MTPLAQQLTGDLLSTRRIFEGGAPGWGSDTARREMLARFEDLTDITAALERAKAGGAQYMVTTGQTRLFQAISPGLSTMPDVLPIVPNIQGFMREAVEHGIPRTGIRRVMRMGLGRLSGLAVRGIGRIPQVLGRDFPTLLLCFIEVELADFRNYNAPVVFLQPQMTDLALAMNNPRILEVFTDAVGRLSGSKPGYITQNFGMLAAKLNEWGMAQGPVITPWEATGASMRPDRESCIEAAANWSEGIWADRGGRTAAPSSADQSFFAETAVRGALRDDDGILGLDSQSTAPGAAH